MGSFLAPPLPPLHFPPLPSPPLPLTPPPPPPPHNPIQEWARHTHGQSSCVVCELVGWSVGQLGKSSRLDHLKAMGCDYISPKILKFCAASLSGPVTSLINKCLESWTFLEEWKTHMITPTPKSGDLSSIRNYRPISLLCILSKVMEKLVYDKIIDFIRPQLSHAQYGFLQKRSSTTQLLTCYSEVVDAFESKTSADVIYLDLRKAFCTNCGE